MSRPPGVARLKYIIDAHVLYCFKIGLPHAATLYLFSSQPYQNCSYFVGLVHYIHFVTSLQYLSK